MHKKHLKRSTALVGVCAMLWGLAPPAVAQTATPPGAGGRANAQPEEIIVTVTKRPEAVRHISGSITAFTSKQLKAIGAQTFADYLTLTPGAVFNPVLPGFSTVIIRGVATSTVPGSGQGTTGYFVNDVPLTDPYFSTGIPDIDTFDVGTVSVLRGPQGTLFGSASLGGAVDYQATKPNLQKYGAEFLGTVEGTQHGGIGGASNIMVNLPIIPDVFAVRGVLTYRDDPGYIDNLGTGTKNANRITNLGGRLLATWQPRAGVQVNYMFLRQREDSYDAGYEEPVIGTLQKSTIQEPSVFTTILHNLRLDADLGFATLTAMATYHEKDEGETTDFQTVFGPILQNQAGPIRADQNAQSYGTTFEVRLASPVGPDHPFDYVFGLMHDATNEHVLTSINGPNVTNAINQQFGPVFGTGIGDRIAANNQFFGGNLYFNGEEEAAFGEASYHFSPELKLTVGGRLFRTKLTTDSTQFGFLQLLSSGLVSQTIAGPKTESGFSPKGSITYTPSSRLMFYALVSKGFRYGGFNVNPPTPSFPTPATFSSDSLINYEVGGRTNFFDNKLQLDATFYYVDWTGIQLTLQTPSGFEYVANAGSARNYGIESTVKWQPTFDLSIATNFTYLNAELAAPFSVGPRGPTIPSGATLPGASKFQVATVVNYSPDEVWGQPLFTLEERYISTAPGPFNQPVTQGGYVLFDARATMHLGRTSVTAFVDNIADTRGITTALANPGFPTQLYLVRPRTVGVTVDVPF